MIWETGVLFQKAVSHGGGVRCVFETVVVFQEAGGGDPNFSETTISKS